MSGQTSVPIARAGSTLTAKERSRGRWSSRLVVPRVGSQLLAHGPFCGPSRSAVDDRLDAGDQMTQPQESASGHGGGRVFEYIGRGFGGGVDNRGAGGEVRRG